MNIDLQPLLHTDDEFFIIDDYIHNTHAPTHNEYFLELLEAYRVER